jgi:antitoxin component HigA of HigAB toxin-antitoxin module
MDESIKTYSELLLETQPQVITNDEQNDANLAHIERLMNTRHRTSDEDRILELLLLLSEEFEDKAYPMQSPWYSMLWYRVQAFVFRW